MWNISLIWAIDFELSLLHPSSYHYKGSDFALYYMVVTCEDNGTFVKARSHIKASYPLTMLLPIILLIMKTVNYMDSVWLVLKICDENYKAQLCINALSRRIQRLTHKRLQIHLCVEMQHINGFISFMHWKNAKGKIACMRHTCAFLPH